MQHRRNGLRDDRRRRALMDDRTSNTSRSREEGEDVSASSISRRTYSKTAIDERRVRIVDLIPIYPIKVALLYLLIASGAAGLLALHHFAKHLVRWADLSRVDSLGSMVQTASLMFTVAVILMVFRIRRHRLDDYRARYRCWLWIAPMLVFACFDSMLNLRGDIALGLESVTRIRLLGQTDGWWVVLWSLAFGAMALRILIETWESRMSMLFTLVSACAFYLAMSVDLNLIVVPEVVSRELATHACRLTGAAFLSIAIIQYARFVWLDAQGLMTKHARVESIVHEEVTEEAAPAKPKRTPSKRNTPRKTSRNATPAREVVKEEADDPNDLDEEESDAQPRKSWFGWGRRKATESEQGTEEEMPVSSSKPKVMREPDQEDTDVEDAPAKKSWFGWGKSSESEPSAEEETAATPTKPRIVKESELEESEAESRPKKSWLGWGREKSETESDEAATEVTQSADSRSTEPEEASPKRGWFSWGKSDSNEEPEESIEFTEAQEQDAENRKEMTPRITTRPKSSQQPRNRSNSESEQPRRTQAPTLTGKYSQQADSGNSAEDEEIVRLESKPDHLMSKAERRRLKKLKRRAGHAA